MRLARCSPNVRLPSPAVMASGADSFRTTDPFLRTTSLRPHERSSLVFACSSRCSRNPPEASAQPPTPSNSEPAVYHPTSLPTPPRPTPTSNHTRPSNSPLLLRPSPSPNPPTHPTTNNNPTSTPATHPTRPTNPSRPPSTPPSPTSPRPQPTRLTARSHLLPGRQHRRARSIRDRILQSRCSRSRSWRGTFGRCWRGSRRIWRFSREGRREGFFFRLLVGDLRF